MLFDENENVMWNEIKNIVGALLKISCVLPFWLDFNVGNKKNYCLKKPHQPIQPKPHLFGLVWFRLCFKSQPNQPKPHAFLSCGLDGF